MTDDDTPTANALPGGDGRERDVHAVLAKLRADVATQGTAHRIDAAHQELTAWLPYIKRRNRRRAEQRLHELERLARRIVEESRDDV